MITRTTKGESFFDSIKDYLIFKEVSYEEGVRKNPSDYKSVNRPEQRNTFFNDMKVMNFTDLEKKYAADFKIPYHTRVKNRIMACVRKIIEGGVHAERKEQR